MLLENKTAVVFAAGGAIASKVARRFAEEGARVLLSSRSQEGAKALADELSAPWESVDATDPDAVRSYVDRIEETHEIDVVFNGIGVRPSENEYGVPSGAMSYENFLRPLTVHTGSQFLTARAAAAHMMKRGRGSIVTISASLSGQFIPFMAGVTASCGAVEALSRTLATEYSSRGVRVNCVRAGGMPETRTIAETTAGMAKTMETSVENASSPTRDNLLHRPLRVDETAALVAYLASDAASGIVGQVVNVCGGAVVSR